MQTALPKLLVVIAIIGVTVGCDRVTKHLAATTLAERPAQSYLSDTVRLQYAENAGAFLGLGAGWPAPVRLGLFTVGNGLVLLAIAMFAVGVPWRAALAIGFALLVSGGASNLVDRIVRGSVIDFMNVGIGPLRTGIFNVADVAILAGAVLVALSSRPRSEPPAPTGSEPPAAL